MQTNQNQALTMYPLFFDPIYKKVQFEMKDGKPSIFYKDDECLYIGETGTSLSDRIFKHTPKHLIQPWFKEGNKIFQIELDSGIDGIARGTIEATFILAYRPKYNKKA